MKTRLLFCLLIAVTFKMFPQSIPNGGFENWNITTFENPMYYFCSNNEENNGVINVTKVTDSYHASVAVRLATVPSGTNINFAFIANGDPMNIAGQGIPYNQQPTGMRFYYKLNTMPNDSALVWVIFKKAGTVIGNYLMKLNGTQTTYALKQYTFALTQSPDSMIFAAASSNPFNYTGPAGSTFQLDSVNFTGVASQPANFNGSFEQWQLETDKTPVGWNLSSNSGFSNSQTTDFYAGNYALELQTTSTGSVAYGNGATNGIPSPSTTLGGSPFSNQTDTLVFYYKYFPANSNDSASVVLNFKKNFIFFAGQSVKLPASTPYTKVKMTINLAMAPDTMLIFLNSSKNWTVPASYAGAIFKIDNMHLTSQLVPVTNFMAQNNACTSQTLQLFDNSANLPSAYSWTMTGATPSTSTLQNPVISYTSGGTYTISHNVSNSYGSGSIVTQTISINITPTVSVTGPNNLCIGSTVTLNVSGASSYTWAAGPASSSITVSPTITTSYTVTGTAVGGCMNMAYMTVTVNPLPTITAASNSSLICTGQSATLTANGGNTYTWTPGGTATSIVVSPTVTSTYTINGTDANGCVNTTSFTQSVSACTGINEMNVNSAELVIYPNPNNGTFTIKGKTDETITITNELGQTVNHVELNSINDHTITLNGMAAGIYFANGLHSKFKIMVLN